MYNTKRSAFSYYILSNNMKIMNINILSTFLKLRKIQINSKSYFVKNKYILQSFSY